MNIDTEVRHITKPKANLFLNGGFNASEAVRFQNESHQNISDTKVLKEQLMDELSSWIENNHLKQVEAARILMVSRPRVSDMVTKKTSKFTIDALVDMLSRAGKSVQLAVG
jgi:predicted XRE-type DNA-binding protein